MSGSREDTVRRGYRAFREGDLAAFRSIYAPDVVHSRPGSNRTSGEYKGIDEVLGLYGLLFELSEGSLALDLQSVRTLGGTVVAVHRVRAERDGKILDVDETIEFTFAGDKIARLDATYSDPAASDAFWG